VYSPETRAQIETELAQARAARAAGNEGRARVCARRAAGPALRAVLKQTGSALDLLRTVQAAVWLSPQARQAVDLLLQKVDEEFELRGGWDLIKEAQVLIDELEQQG
jgi:hypothetical protein